MTQKLPWAKFFYDDWAMDLRLHPMEIEGAWIRICCQLYRETTRGKATKPLEQWARVLITSEEKTKEILDYLRDQNIGDISEDNAGTNANITVISRRIVKDEKEREGNRLRQKRHQDKKKEEAEDPPESQEPKRKNNAEITGRGQKTEVRRQNIEIEEKKEEGPKAPPSLPFQDPLPTPKNGKHAIPKKPKITIDQIHEVDAGWNLMASTCGLPGTRYVSDDRADKIRTRLSNRWWRENWRAALEAIPKYPKLLGENDGWRANIDWFISKDSRAAAILEGRYESKKPNTGRQGI